MMCRGKGAINPSVAVDVTSSVGGVTTGGVLFRTGFYSSNATNDFIVSQGFSVTGSSGAKASR